MRGLTPEEFEYLLDCAEPCDGGDDMPAFTAEDEALSERLTQDGRVREAWCRCGQGTVDEVTPAGRAAIGIWQAMPDEVRALFQRSAKVPRP